MKKSLSRLADPLSLSFGVNMSSPSNFVCAVGDPASAVAPPLFTTDYGITIDTRFCKHYAALKRIAQSRINRDGCGASLDSASLVNECYLKLRDCDAQVTGDDAAFLAYASQTMRSVIVDSAREASAMRRGGDCRIVSIDTVEEIEVLPAPSARDNDLIGDIGKAIDTLGRTQPRLAQVVALRYLRDSSFDEIARDFSLNVRTIRGDWAAASLELAQMLA
jgi:RNA polymerase sigma factor (TIGR02999 family)